MERVNQIARERQRAALTAERERIAREKHDAEERVRQKREKLAREEQIRQTNRKRARRLIDQSGVIGYLEELKQNIRAEKKDIVIDLDKATVTLLWGRYHINSAGKVDYSSYTRLKNYSQITVVFNLDDESLSINRRKIDGETWKKDKDPIIDALAGEYLNPDRVNTTESADNAPTYSSSSGGECCHS